MLIYTTSAALGTTVESVPDVAIPMSEITIQQMALYIASADLKLESMTVEEERAYANKLYLESVGYRAHGGLA